MKKKYERNFLLAGVLAHAILILVWGYSGMGILWRVYSYLVSMGILGLYYYNKDAKEEREKKTEPQNFVISDQRR